MHPATAEHCVDDDQAALCWAQPAVVNMLSVRAKVYPCWADNACQLQGPASLLLKVLIWISCGKPWPRLTWQYHGVLGPKLALQ